ncbi:hypothetical protein QAD02_004485, partial [Eretmocerus hayati]
LLNQFLYVRALLGVSDIVVTNDYSFVVFIGDFPSCEVGVTYAQCLGVLITEKHLVAVEQCITKRMENNKIQFCAGFHTVSKCTKYEGIITATYNDWVAQKELSPLLSSQNIAIIAITSSKFSDLRIKQAFVPKKNEEFYGVPVTAIGFPYQRNSKSDLNNATLSLLSKLSCEHQIPEHFKAYAAEKLLCTSSARSRIMRRDIGGPILYEDDVLVGIHVYETKPTINNINLHVRFNYVRDFIESNIPGAKLLQKPCQGKLKVGSSRAINAPVQAPNSGWTK